MAKQEIKLYASRPFFMWALQYNQNTQQLKVFCGKGHYEYNINSGFFLLDNVMGKQKVKMGDYVCKNQHGNVWLMQAGVLARNYVTVQ